MTNYRVSVRSVGNGALMHRFPDLQIAGLVSSVKLAGKAKGSPGEEAEAGAYRMEREDGVDKGQLCWLAEHFQAGFIRAAANHVIQGRGKKTYKSLMAFVSVAAEDGGETIGLKRDGEPLFDYLIDSRPAIINRARIIRHRPHIPVWECSFLVSVVKEELVPSDVLKSIIEFAGEQERIGDYRLRFGRYELVAFDAID